MLTEPVTDDDTADIRAVVRDFLSERLPMSRIRELAAEPDGFNRADWAATSEMGWPALALSEELGGAGYGPRQFAVLSEELGRNLGGGPLLASAGFALPVLTACTDPVAAELISEIASGEKIATLVDDPGGRLSVEPSDTIVGVAPAVLDALAADIFVVAHRETVLIVDRYADDMSVESAPVADPTRRVARITFRGTRSTRLDAGTAGALTRARATADVNLAATHVGGALDALEKTLDYLKTRHQFGKPIGSFQALKHRAADAAVDVSLAREVVHAAATSLEVGDDGEATLAAQGALVLATETHLAVSADAVQLHGGIGFTEEHDIGFHYRRALTDRDLRGPLAERRSQLVAALGWC